MHNLNQKLLASDIGLVAAQHLEGGPEAQLYLDAGEAKLEGELRDVFQGGRQQRGSLAGAQHSGREATGMPFSAL